jgi:hypothetical protein
LLGQELLISDTVLHNTSHASTVFVRALFITATDRSIQTLSVKYDDHVCGERIAGVIEALRITRFVAVNPA